MPKFAVKLVPKDLMPLWEEFWDGDGSLASTPAASSEMPVVRTIEIVASSNDAAGTLAEAKTPGYLAVRGATELLQPE